MINHCSVPTTASPTSSPTAAKSSPSRAFSYFTTERSNLLYTTILGHCPAIPTLWYERSVTQGPRDPVPGSFIHVLIMEKIKGKVFRGGPARNNYWETLASNPNARVVRDAWVRAVK